jgi:hypothetical protein
VGCLANDVAPDNLSVVIDAPRVCCGGTGYIKGPDQSAAPQDPMSISGGINEVSDDIPKIIVVAR